jgi:hypothetical protein
MEVHEFLAVAAAFGQVDTTHKTNARSGKKPPPRIAAAASKAGAIADDSEEVNTRTEAGRAAYQDAILAFLKKQSEPIGAAEVRKACGGTSLQARKALNVLIENEEVTFEGKARATKYAVA